MLVVPLVLPVVIVCAATGVGSAAGDVMGDGVAGDVDGDGAAGGTGATVMLAVPTMRVLWVMLDVGALQVRCRVNGGAPGDGVVGAVDGEGVVGDASRGSVADEAGEEERALVRWGVMVGSSVWVVSGRWVWLVVWCSVCMAGAGYLRCARWRGCADGGGLSAWWRWVAPWSCCWRWAAACVGRWVPLCAAVAAGVGALGAWWVRLGVGARVDVYLVWAAGGLWAVGVLLPCVWLFVLSGGAWLVCALRGRCGAWSARMVPVWVFWG